MRCSMFGQANASCSTWKSGLFVDGTTVARGLSFGGSRFALDYPKNCGYLPEGQAAILDHAESGVIAA
jgi:hypothetical protein